MPIYDLRPRISRIDDVSYVTVQGGDIREIVVEVDPQRLVAAGLSIADVADRVGKDHRLRAVGRLDRGPLQFQVLLNSQAEEPPTWSSSCWRTSTARRSAWPTWAGRSFPTKIALRGSARTERRRCRDRLPPPAGRRPGHFPAAQRNAARTAEIGPAGRRDHAGLRPGQPGADLDRQRPRRHARRRRLQRARSCCCSSAASGPRCSRPFPSP